MLKDKVVRIKLKKYFHEQKPISYVGKVTYFSDDWVVVNGKGLMLARHQPNGVQIDQAAAPVMLPRDAIESIRVLPENFDIKKLTVTTEGQQLLLTVEGAADTYIGEMGEG